jgi:hypothetical protein
MADVASDLKTWSTTASSNSPSGSTAVGTGLDDNLRELQKVVRQDLASKGSDIASATTTDLGAVAGLMHDITGTTTITGLGTVSAGIWKIIKFEDALTLTHNATSLILPGGANITTADGDIALMFSEGSGNWRCVSYFKAATGAHVNAASATASGVVELATAAETLTGSDSTRAITPAGFAGNLDITGAAGYYKLPGGLIMQWDTVSTDSNGDATWTYPTAFSSTVFSVQGTSANGDAALTVSLGTPTTTTCAVYTRNHSDAQVSIAVLMFAVGV